LLSSPAISAPKNLGIRQSFADVGATVADNFHMSLQAGQSFLSNLR
jgi:phosphopentomutase